MEYKVTHIPPEDPEQVRIRDKAHWTEIDDGELEEDDNDAASGGQ